MPNAIWLNLVQFLETLSCLRRNCNDIVKIASNDASGAQVID